MDGEAQEVLFAVLHSPGPGWLPDKPFEEQPDADLHVGHMARYGYAIVLGGPFLDNSGGMSIFRMNDLAAAEEMAMADPAVKSGLLKVTVRPWMIATRDGISCDR